jgi:predicted ATPase/DNA-binding CsgD family transcriptional regulator
MADLVCPVLIGREAEFGRLRSALSAAQTGSGGIVFLLGEAGIGKSRLAGALAAEASAAGALVLAGRAVPASISAPYRPVTEALQQGLRERGVPADPSLVPWLPALRAVVPAVAGPGSTAPGTASHGELSDAVRGEAVLQLLRRIRDGRALLLLLEDLHWADPDTVAVLEYLSDNLAGEPILCVATCREDTFSACGELIARLTSRRTGLVLALERLTPDETAAMVRACLPSAADELILRVQALSEGVPFLVEESLTAPGVPRSFADGIRVRMAGLSPPERLVLDTAALLGRQFDWRLLPAATSLSPDVVDAALEHGVRSQLLGSDGGAFRFRHMLTREAVLGELLPTRRSALAVAVLAALRESEFATDDDSAELLADLALAAGRKDEAGAILVRSGRAALTRGALATSIGTLRRATALLPAGDKRLEAATLLVESLALAGQVDDAMTTGDRLLAELADADRAGARMTIHLKLAHAAVDATRWADARRQLAMAADLLTARPDASLGAETDVLTAEVALADSDIATATRLAEHALAQAAASPEVRCHALELLGRLHRSSDLNAARESFERALSTAQAAGLAVWRLRALHELGTIDMFDHAGSSRLRQARQTAGELGAASTGAMIDLQLTAAAIFRFELGEAERCAQSALTTSTRLGLTKTRAIVLVFLAEVHALGRNRAGMDHFLALARAAEPGDAEIEGSALAGAQGMLALLTGDIATALDRLRRGVARLDTLPQQGPAPYRALYPLLLAATGDAGAGAATNHASQTGLLVNRVNRGLLSYASAILAGRAGELGAATQLAVDADANLHNYPVWADLARLYAAAPAAADGWGQPRQWLQAAADSFDRYGIEPLAERCRQLLHEPPRSRWARLGVTDRQADVLRLVAAGRSNKEVAAELHLSIRTVEKHVEALLRTAGARSRTQLVAIAGPEYPDAP